VEERPGFALIRVSGPGAVRAFGREGGGHRWQRVPPTEKRGRVQSSTITVAVLPAPDPVAVVIDERDLSWSTCRASGNGGQALQKTESAVQLTHGPSGIQVRCESERSQQQNRATALGLLRARLLASATEAAKRERDAARRAQAGCGERGDKRRTVREQEGLVHDHETGQTFTFRDYVRGKWELR
jgi:peptide chain release factor 1